MVELSLNTRRLDGFYADSSIYLILIVNLKNNYNKKGVWLWGYSRILNNYFKILLSLHIDLINRKYRF